ncbi:magnesium transporter [Gaertneriomyces semiglobifer]|nr:magnesium transporter [Gaertneriomyces semiglobifer]
MTSWAGRLLYTIGALLLLHSGYSAFEHLAYIKLIGTYEPRLPIDIITECLVSVILCIAGVVLVAGDLQPIALENEISKLKMDSISGSQSFRILNHRGTALFRPST